MSKFMRDVANNSVCEVSIERMAFGGAGVGYLPDGKVCFVPGTLPGERVRVRVRVEKKSFAEADMLEIIGETSLARIVPPCPHYGICGGCQYQHIAYSEQLRIKGEHIADALRRIGGVAAPQVETTVASPLEYGYRNRVSVHTRAGETGFFQRKSNRVVDIEKCLLASEIVNAELAKLRASRPRDGERTLREPATYRGFRQVNDLAAGLMLAAVEASLGEPNEKKVALLVDAYSGAGFFASALAGRFERVIGIEWSEPAIAHARSQAVENATYICSDVGVALPAVLGEAVLEGTTLLLDPPAEGCAPAVIDAILAAPPAQIIYVSCDPPTLARDVKKLSSAYRHQCSIPIDMFPQTAEVESVTALSL